MDLLNFKKYRLPDVPGVYLFKKGKAILYIGKATSLKDRIKSYFSKDIAFVRSLLIEKMVEKADALEWIQTDSVLEALILESNLVKKYKPTHNTQLKDDKSFSFVVITTDKFPRVFIVRGKDFQNKYDVKKDFKYIFGPYPEGGSLRVALKIIRKIFPFFGEKTSRSPFNQQVGLSPRDNLSKADYAKTIRNIKLFFEGKNSQILKNLNTEMKRLAKEQEFEKADKIKRQIFALGHINDIALIKEEKLSSDSNYRIEAYDVAHLSEKDRVGVMVVVEGGGPNKGEYRKFNIKKPKGGDTGALEEILERRLEHPEWPFPKLIVVDGGKAQKNAAEKILIKFGYQIPVVSVVKGFGHKAKNLLGSKQTLSQKEGDILLANSEAHRFALKFHRRKRSIM